jgi:hypothetical protein
MELFQMRAGLQADGLKRKHYFLIEMKILWSWILLENLMNLPFLLGSR